MSEVKNKKVKKEKSKVQIWIENIVQVVVVVACLVFSIIVISNPGGVSSEDYSKINVSSMPVLSNSMSGTFEEGDLIFGEKLEDGEILDIGEVAIFVVDDANQSEYRFINTHRVVGYYYEYKIDGNLYTGYTDLLSYTIKYNEIENKSFEDIEKYVYENFDWTDFAVRGYITKADNTAIYYNEDGKLKDEKNVYVIDNYIPLRDDVVGKWTGAKLAGVGAVITWMQQPTNFFFVIIIPLLLLFGYNVWIVISYIIEVKTAKARKLALEEAKSSGISKEDEEEIKRKAIEEYLKKMEAEKASSEEKVEEKE